MAIQSAFYFTDGTTRTFPSTKHIASSANVAVWMKRVVDDVWELTSYELWTLVNNSIVFTVAPQSTVYSQIELRIADEADELTESPSNIALVAGSIESVSIVGDNIVDVNTVSTNITAVQNASANTTNINTVATNAASVNTVALNIVDINVTADNITDINIVASDLLEPISEINTVATDIANVNTVGLAITNVNTVATSIANVNTIVTNIDNVNTVAGISAGVTTVATNNANVTTVATNIVGLNSVVANLTEVLLADDNAAIATTKASEATTAATDAQLSAWEAEAEKMTADSYATEAENVFVKVYTSNGDGTFTATDTTEHSALHWAAKATLAGQGDAINIHYDNATSGLSATNVQTAIDELDTRSATHIPLSGITSYHLLSGNLALANSVITSGMATTLYTGNGTGQSVVTGIDMATQWGNDASEKFGGLVWLKNRSTSDWNNLFDTVRGATYRIVTNSTNAQNSSSTYLTSFNTNGFSVGIDTGCNGSAYSLASWNFQTTHRTSGTTNHGKAYTCHYNPYTGFTMVKYEGSGIAGHEIPHHLGRKLGFTTVKNLSTAQGWITGINTLKGAGYLQLNLTDAFTTEIDSIGNWFPTSLNTETTICSGANNNFDNTSTSQYILYGWANSYFDESNKLIGNYEIGVYQGTGASGNKVTTRGKPAWVMIKRLDSTSNWFVHDNKRNNINVLKDGILFTNLSNAEDATYDYITFNEDGFTHNYFDATYNASGGQYLYMVAYDTNSNGGGSFYEKPTDNAQVQINNALIPLAKGYDSNGVKNEIVVANETITGITLTEGKNYIYKTDSGYGVTTIAPTYGKTNPLSGDFYNILTNKWYDNTDTEITESRNYLNHIVYADHIGNPLYVEELPKTEYKDSVNINRLAISETTWNNPDGIPYADSGIRGVPDTSFSPTGARIYPDGTIRGKSSYGEYVKYPDGILICSSGTASGVINTAIGNIFASGSVTESFPYVFVTAPSVSSSLAFVNGWSNISDVTTSNLKTRAYCYYNVNVSATIRFIAIGRWK